MAFLLYHWSPTDRRQSVREEGLVPGSWSTDLTWKAPYLCFSDSPSLAWALSPMMPRGQLIDSWDLWMIWSNRVEQYEAVLFEQGEPGAKEDPFRIKEFRVYETIAVGDLWFVGTRTQDGMGEELG